jgi:hypothetical protein
VSRSRYAEVVSDVRVAPYWGAKGRGLLLRPRRQLSLGAGRAAEVWSYNRFSLPALRARFFHTASPKRRPPSRGPALRDAAFHPATRALGSFNRAPRPCVPGIPPARARAAPARAERFPRGRKRYPRGSVATPRGGVAYPRGGVATSSGGVATPRVCVAPREGAKKIPGYGNGIWHAHAAVRQGKTKIPKGKPGIPRVPARSPPGGHGQLLGRDETLAGGRRAPLVNAMLSRS